MDLFKMIDKQRNFIFEPRVHGEVCVVQVNVFGKQLHRTDRGRAQLFEKLNR